MQSRDEEGRAFSMSPALATLESLRSAAATGRAKEQQLRFQCQELSRQCQELSRQHRKDVTTLTRRLQRKSREHREDKIQQRILSDRLSQLTELFLMRETRNSVHGSGSTPGTIEPSLRWDRPALASPTASELTATPHSKPGYERQHAANELAAYIMQMADRHSQNGLVTMNELDTWLPHHPFTKWLTSNRGTMVRADKNRDGALSLQELQMACKEFLLQSQDLEQPTIPPADSKVVWVDNLDLLKRRSRVVITMEALLEQGVDVSFVSSTDACISQVATGGVSVVVTNIGRSRADSGLILIQQLRENGFTGAILIHSKSAVSDSQLAASCIDCGATAVLSPDASAEDAIVAELLRTS